ncbi:MAG: hypothetical protein CVV60_05505 [Tenericutes bacterium HGW-Tenericutes-5]|jgi:ABC-2 type transport system permease protein|nr:MAG: hypothetical protein CVV60_05505 [Tenericutes bacterium HGW-Tenericutes-5]
MIKLSLLKKELMEYFKTPKILILSVLFIFFAIASPALAKYMNEILKAVASDLEIVFPDPTFKDAWLQFYKNMNSLCLIVYLIVLTGVVSSEKSKGSIVLVLTKNVSRLQFLLCKFLAGVIVYTLLLLVSTFVSAYYTQILFGVYSYPGMIESIILLWVLGVFYTALGIFVSTLAKSPTTSALLGFFGFALLQVLNISENISLYNPAGASSIVNQILVGSFDMSLFFIPVLIALLSSGVMFGISYYIFTKQEI